MENHTREGKLMEALWDTPAHRPKEAPGRKTSDTPEHTDPADEEPNYAAPEYIERRKVGKTAPKMWATHRLATRWINTTTAIITMLALHWTQDSDCRLPGESTPNDTEDNDIETETDSERENGVIVPGRAQKPQEPPTGWG